MTQLYHRHLPAIVRVGIRPRNHLWLYCTEAIGQPIPIPPNIFKEYGILVARIGRGERIVHHETTRRRKNGEDINVSLTYLLSGMAPIR